MSNKIAIDINSIMNIGIGGNMVKMVDILNAYHESGVLIYNSQHGKEPIIIEGDIKLYDANKTDDVREYLKKIQ